MTRKDEILALMIDDVKQRASAISDFIVDKENSYEDRLEVFVKTPYHLYTKSDWLLETSPCEDEVDWNDKFFFERYDNVNLVELVRNMLLGSYDHKFRTEEKNTFINSVLDQGYHSFTLDW